MATWWPSAHTVASTSLCLMIPSCRLFWVSSLSAPVWGLVSLLCFIPLDPEIYFNNIEKFSSCCISIIKKTS
jgi:hypothetical protein